MIQQVRVVSTNPQQQKQIEYAEAFVFSTHDCNEHAQVATNQLALTLVNEFTQSEYREQHTITEIAV